VRNNSVHRVRNFSGKSKVVTATTYSNTVFRVIQREYAPLKHAAKLLARHAGTTPRTAENWLAGTHAPNGEKLLNLMAECATLADEVNRLVAERRSSRGEG